MLARQLGLFGNDEPGFDAGFGGIRRIELAEGAWLEHLPSWLAGHERLFEHLVRTTHFHSESRQMYDREVEVPRCHARLPGDGPGHAVIWQVQAALRARYGEAFASVSLGAPRRFLVRRTGGGRSLALSLGSGDLLVMGGSCQRTYQHAVPKVARAEPRLVVMFRPVWVDPDIAADAHTE
jgi:alkylated DNA repair dioxygenase AlkB